MIKDILTKSNMKYCIEKEFKEFNTEYIKGIKKPDVIQHKIEKKKELRLKREQFLNERIKRFEERIKKLRDKI